MREAVVAFIHADHACAGGVVTAIYDTLWGEDVDRRAWW